MGSVVVRKNGGFYSIYGNDCYVLYYLFNYRIIDDKVGFPLNSYNKVINALDDNCINYVVTNTNVLKNYKRKNNYDKFVDLGKKKYNLNYRIDSIIKKLNNLTEKDVDEILSLIEEKL